ncbi:MAG: hypothetical protein H2B03_03655 [Nitrosopumilaceae archaeon]|uniref:Uncharacterized protein n=1 Tax=Candidatus Nitrosomaritimum aestuariumsis TaxID=3342354 RepID=A0AC60VY62_9ARCH|nr:hypothetical protein [Nitrosopumilaceae archaeon]
MSDELEKLLEKVHQEITIFDFDGKPVPCIILDEKKYDEILSKIAGKPTSINTDLNILQDGLGHVFVEVLLTFSQGGIMEKMLVNANTDLKFFESLAQTSMIALSSPKSVYGKDNVFMIQLPKPEKAHDALEIIKKGLKQNNA